MATIKIEFSRVFCKETTSGPGNDEIYFAVFPTLLRKVDTTSVQRKNLPGALSGIQRGVREKTEYQPTFVSGGSTLTIDTEDAQTVALAIWMFEEDDGAHYKQLKTDLDPNKAQPQVTNWGTIDEYVPDDPTDWVAWAKAAYKLVKRLLKHIAKDDLIAKRLVEFRVADTFRSREYTFKGDGGEYHMTLTFA